MSKNRLAEIQKPYFDWITSNFGNLAKEALRNNITAGTVAKDFLSDPSRKERLISSLPEFFENINSYWDSVYETMDFELGKLTGLKARFGGDIGPQSIDHVFPNTGLYFNTIIVPDPLLRIANFPNEISKINEYYFLKYAIEQVLAKDIYQADIYPPIAVLTADDELMNNGNFNNLANIAKMDCVILTNQLYDKRFDNYHEVNEFYAKFSNSKEAVNEIVNPDLIYFIEDTSREPLAQFDALLERNSLDWNLEKLQVDYQGSKYLLLTFFGRLMQINDVLNRSYIQNAHPLVTAPVSFHWLKWKIQANQELILPHIAPELKLNLSITNALLSKELGWLGNVTLDNLIGLRKKGYLSELRTTITKEINSLSNISINELNRVINQVDQNLSLALNEHQERITELDIKFRTDLAISIPTLLISVFAATQPSIFPLSTEWVTPISGLIGTSSLKSIIQSTVKHIRERKKLSTTPVGFLWNAKFSNLSKLEKNI